MQENDIKIIFVPEGFEEHFEKEFPTVKRMDLIIRSLNDDSSGTLVEVNDRSFDHLMFILNELGLKFRVLVGVPSLPSPLGFSNLESTLILSLHNFMSSTKEENTKKSDLAELLDQTETVPDDDESSFESNY